MTQEPFIQPRFVGPRFEGHTLPLSAAKLVGGIEALMGLKDGWLEGEGKAPNPEHLTGLVNKMAQLFPAGLESPAVVPTEDGNVVFEWIRPQARIEVEVNFAGKQLDFYATNLKTNDFEEATYSPDEWTDIFTKVSTLNLLACLR